MDANTKTPDDLRRGVNLAEYSERGGSRRNRADAGGVTGGGKDGGRIVGRAGLNGSDRGGRGSRGFGGVDNCFAGRSPSSWHTFGPTFTYRGARCFRDSRRDGRRGLRGKSWG